MGVKANNNIDEPLGPYPYKTSGLASAQMGADIINCSWVSGFRLPRQLLSKYS
ncbi:hypothetical protein Ct9H90mP29_01490 [bacterium]|nr:MAG: hypothetical protein Ct9H90mP29_01490 [bacterium]